MTLGTLIDLDTQGSSHIADDDDQEDDAQKDENDDCAYFDKHWALQNRAHIMLLIIMAIPLSKSKLNNKLMSLTSWGAPSSSNIFPRVQLKPANMLIVILE